MHMRKLHKSREPAGPGTQKNRKMLTEIAKTKAKPEPRKPCHPRRHKTKKKSAPSPVSWKNVPQSGIRRLLLAGCLTGSLSTLCNFVEGDNFYDPDRFSSRLRLTHHPKAKAKAQAKVAGHTPPGTVVLLDWSRENPVVCQCR